MRKKIRKIHTYVDYEALFWLTAIFLLAFSDPMSETHYTLFIPSLLFDIPSPGYNLGHSISHLFHGNILTSFQTHPLGIITVVVLLSRSYFLLKNSFKISIEKGHI